MGRILFFLALGFLAVLLFKSWQRKQQGPRTPKRPEAGRPLDHSQQSILPCAHCNAYSPLAEGVMMQGRFYCGLEHAKAAGEKVA